ncbi:hypothetical protein LLG95_18190 [bacterium]|nr:hypothetical protein [bacterium]
MTLPDEKPARHWKRWLLMTAAVACLCLALPFVIVTFIFATSKVSPERIAPPKAMMAYREQTIAKNPQPFPAPNVNYEKFVANGPNKTAAVLIPKINDVFTSRTLFPDTLFQYFSRRDTLTPEEIDWLKQNQETIANILKLAGSGGFPSISNEQAARIPDDQLPKLPYINFLTAQQSSRVLAAECRRRRDAHDYTGAADCLVAIDTLAQSVSEPRLINVLVAVAMKSIGYRELRLWLEHAPMPNEIATRLRDKLSAAKPLDIRPCVELEYRAGRQGLIQYLNGSFEEIMRSQPNGNSGNYYRGKKIDVFLVFDELSSLNVKPVTQYFSAATNALRVKSSADAIIRDYDKFYEMAFDDLGSGRISENRSRLDQFAESSTLPLVGMNAPVANYDEANARVTTTEAMRQIDLAALDLILNPTASAAKQPDPFTTLPLRRIDEPTTTTLYSLGPDRADQRAAITYDPTNGTHSVGDIFIHVPQR